MRVQNGWALLAALFSAKTALAGPSGSKEQQFGDWVVTTSKAPPVDVVASVQTKSNDHGELLMVTCEADLFRIQLLNMGLVFYSGPHQAEISFDGESFSKVDDASLPLDLLPQLRRSATLYVRWTIREGVISETFSLKGASAAIDVAASACKVPL